MHIQIEKLTPKLKVCEVQRSFELYTIQKDLRDAVYNDVI